MREGITKAIGTEGNPLFDRRFVVGPAEATSTTPTRPTTKKRARASTPLSGGSGGGGGGGSPGGGGGGGGATRRRTRSTKPRDAGGGEAPGGGGGDGGGTELNLGALLASAKAKLAKAKPRALYTVLYT